MAKKRLSNAEINRIVLRGIKANADRIFDISQKYVPVDKGFLKHSGDVYTEKDGATIIYRAPYSCISLQPKLKPYKHFTVETTKGKKTIQKLVPGDLLFNGFDRYNPIIAVEKLKVEKPDIYQIETETGKKINLTGNHLVPTQNGLKYVRDLTLKDYVYTIEESQGHVWCKGETKTTNQIVKQIGEKLQGKPLSEKTKKKMKEKHWSTKREHGFNYKGLIEQTCKFCGKKEFRELRKIRTYCSKECYHKAQSKHISELNYKRWRTIPPQMRYRHSHGGYRKDLDHYVRSSWEANIARLLNFLDLHYAYEAKRFELKNGSYCPDFYLPEYDMYIEVKGYPDETYKKAIQFTLEYPKISLLIIDAKCYHNIEKAYGEKLPQWEWKKSPRLKK